MKMKTLVVLVAALALSNSAEAQFGSQPIFPERRVDAAPIDTFRSPRDSEGRPGSEQERIKHLMGAAHSLRQAGFAEESEKLTQRARELQIELFRKKAPGSNEELLAEVRELRNSVNEMRAELRLLRQELHARNALNLQPRMGPAVSPESMEEGRVKLPAAPSRHSPSRNPSRRITDEELDSIPRERSAPERNRAKKSPEESADKPADGIEFELVPVPDPMESEQEEDGPTPTPVPASAPVKR